MNLLQIWKRMVKLKILVDAQQFDAALEEIERLAKKSDNPQLDKWRITCKRQIARREYQLACELLEEGNCRGAIQVLEKIENWYARNEKKRQKKLHEARRVYEEGILREKAGGEAVARARELVQTGHLDEAIARLQLLPELSGEGRELLDVVRQRKGKIAADVEKARELLQEDDIAGAEKLHEKLCDECGDGLKILRLLAADIDTARSMIQLGKAEKLEGLGRFDEAAEIVEQLQLRELIPDEKRVERIIERHRKFHLQQGEIALAGQTERCLPQARHHLEQARRLSPDHEDASHLARRIARLETEIEQGRQATVQEYVEKGKSFYFRTVPDLKSALIYFDMALAEEGAHSEALSLKRRVGEELEQIEGDWQQVLQKFEEQDFAGARSLLAESKGQFHPEAAQKLAEIEERQRRVERLIERAGRTDDPREGLRLLREELPAVWPDWNPPVELESRLRRMLSCVRRLDAARSAFASGNGEQAIDLLNRALRESAIVSDWQLHGAEDLLEQWTEEYQATALEEIRKMCAAGRFTEAATSARKAVGSFREQPQRRQIFQDRLAEIEGNRQTLDALCQKAEDAIAQEALDRASGLVEELIESFPSCPSAVELRSQLAEAYQKREEGESADVHCAAAEKKMAVGYYRDAIADFDRILDLVPDHAGALQGKNLAIARYMEMQEKWQEAAGWVEEKQYRRAISELEALVRDEPECQTEAADMLSQIDDSLRQADSICTALDDEPDPHRARLLVDRLKGIDPHRQGLEDLCATIERQCELSQLYIEAKSAAQNGHQEESRDILARLFSIDPRHAEGRTLQQQLETAEEISEKKRLDEGRAAELLQAIETEPNLRVARMRLDNELLGDLYPGYSPALEFRAVLEEKFRAWTAFQHGMRSEKGSDLATLRSAMEHFGRVQRMLRDLDIDLSSSGIDTPLVEQHLEAARTNLRRELLRQIDLALAAEQFSRARELLEKALGDFPNDGDFNSKRAAMATRSGDTAH